MYLTSETWLCAFGVLVAVLLRCGTTLHPYSGQGKPPMFGDYEAQRHWMEVTLHLPVKQWYHNSTENDLLYWGLDYPPLTAYHSYLCGWIASLINPDYVALRSSRGYESEGHKLFMRYTVLVADLFLYVPAVILYFLLSSKMYKRMDVQVKKTAGNLYFSPHIAILLCLFYPGIILIDHGHFQYNCVSLAFAIFAVAFICIHKTIIGSIFFCLALNYKQMELYHSLPFFMYLLSTCVPKPGQDASSGIKKFCKLAFTVLITFCIIWSPFLLDIKDSLQVLHRLFPLSRGVFEDKVANFWCTLNVAYKFKTKSQEQMVRYCTLATLVAVLPSSVDLFLKPNVRKLLPALINSSLAFFIFSFQVHEKSILLAAIPATLYLQVEPFTCFWFLIISVFSMFPLIVKDALTVAFVALTVFYIVSFHVCFEYSHGKSQNRSITYFPRYSDIMQIILDIRRNEKSLYSILKRHKQTLFALFKLVAVSFSLLGCLVLMVLMLTFNPPESYPDIFPLLISSYSCVHFLGFFVYFNVAQFKIPQAMEDVRHIKLKDS